MTPLITSLIASLIISQVLAGPCSRNSNALFELHRLRGMLLGVIVCGIREVSRAIITLKDENEKTPAERASGRKALKILVEGTGLQAVMGTAGVMGHRTKSTHIMEVERTLGIEAARQTIVDEITSVKGHHVMEVGCTADCG